MHLYNFKKKKLDFLFDLRLKNQFLVYNDGISTRSSLFIGLSDRNEKKPIGLFYQLKIWMQQKKLKHKLRKRKIRIRRDIGGPANIAIPNPTTPELKLSPFYEGKTASALSKNVELLISNRTQLTCLRTGKLECFLSTPANLGMQLVDA